MKNIILPEIVAIGIYNSQVAAKNKIISKNRKTTMFEIEIPIEKGGISYINSEEISIDRDILICAKPGQVRHTKFPFKCYYIHFILKEGQIYDALVNIPNFIKTKKSEKYKDIFTKMCKYYNTALENDIIILQSLILELIYTLSEDCEKQAFRDKVKNSNYEMIERVIKYIKENLTSDLSLTTVADYAAFSPIHFHNCFKASTGKTLHEFVESERIKKAANLLISTDMTLTQIAYECGFSSQSYFSYAFKKAMKLTPREYAKETFKKYEY